MKTLANRPIALAAAALALSMATAAAQAELVTNGGFETGDFSGWTVTPAATGSAISVETFAIVAHSGTGSAQFGAGRGLPGQPDDIISQSLATQAGAWYDVSFWLLNNGSNLSHFAFNWDGGAAELDLTNALTQAYTLYSYSFQATGTSTAIGFAGWTNGSVFRLDEVSVTPTEPDAPTLPEPSSSALVVLGLLAAAALRRRH